MSDYIKREDAFQAVADNNYSKDITLKGYDRIIDAIYDIPSADVVEVVRCKDCKYYKEYISNRGTAMMCFCPCCIGGQGKKKPTDYCSYGERKDDE